MDAVCQLGGCPLLTRSDPGSENVVVAALQATFREHGDDDFAGSKSHQYGRSVHNQRIEAFWSYLKPRLTYWIEVFQGLVDEGEFEVGNFIQTTVSCLFCLKILISIKAIGTITGCRRTIVLLFLEDAQMCCTSYLIGQEDKIYYSLCQTE
ncbi:Hypp786 [Branchiostoma lanceolatum]|uniref:Hypp786 protein n=1 Tax=Branchiostoma lanceolatum TaxID=7740 RepID=A0A8J9WEA9_BRALA|nr:Hypp786 [Branchiostoma lanceolatum]